MTMTAAWYASLLCLLALAAFSAACTESDAPARPFDAHAHELLLDELLTHSGEMSPEIDNALATDRTDRLALGNPRAIYFVDRSRHVGPFGLSQDPVLTESRDVLVPVAFDGNLIGTMHAAARRSDGSWNLRGPFGLRCARAIDALQPSDNVFFAEDGGGSAMLVARGNSVSAIEECSWEPIPQVATMAEYHEYIESRPPYFPGLDRKLKGLCLGALVFGIAAVALMTARRRHGAE